MKWNLKLIVMINADSKIQNFNFNLTVQIVRSKLQNRKGFVSFIAVPRRIRRSNGNSRNLTLFSLFYSMPLIIFVKGYNC